MTYHPPEPDELAENPLTYTLGNMRPTGLLWAVNRTLLHPRGYAMALHYPAAADPKDVAENRVEATGWEIVGDGSEPWRYAPELDEDGAFGAFDLLLKLARQRHTTPKRRKR